MMTIAAARLVRNGAALFVGIGLPSAVANLARLTHAPDTVLIYESGTINARPAVLPLSIGDGELAETADAVVSVPEMFAYWLQAGRIDLGFLGAAQIDRFANINTTVIGDYRRPRTRLPGAGGATEIAAFCGEVLITMRQNRRAFVQALDFVTSAGHLDGAGGRERLRVPGRGPTAVITDLGVMRPDPATRELTLTSVHPGVEIEQVKAATGWPLRIAPAVTTTPPPTATELAVLRDLQARTARAHAGDAAAHVAPRP
jgi:glutaconate CoA-transferase subunit B